MEGEGRDEGKTHRDKREETGMGKGDRDSRDIMRTGRRGQEQERSLLCPCTLVLSLAYSSLRCIVSSLFPPPASAETVMLTPEAHFLISVQSAASEQQEREARKGKIRLG